MTIHTHEFTGSSAIASASYDDETCELTIYFLNSRDYVYKDVLIDTYNDLINAASPGKYFAGIKKDLVLK